MNKTHVVPLLASALLLLGSAVNADAQTAYPSKAIRLIVPYPAGGGTDAVARAVFQKLGESLGQAVVVENKAGAGTTIGLAELARSAPDGYTLGIGGTSDPLLPLLYDKLPFNPKTDLVFVTTLATAPIALVTGPSISAHSVSEFVSLAKSQSASPMGYASVGVASPQHLAGIYFSALSGAPMNHVPYKGTAPALTDLMGGHIPAAMLGLPSLLPYARTGKLRILGVASAKRSSLAPDIPTISEGGVKGFEAGYWYHVVVPKGTPIAVVERLRAEIDKVVRSPEMKDSLAKSGFETLTLTPEESERALKADTARWTKIIRDNNIRGS